MKVRAGVMGVSAVMAGTLFSITGPANAQQSASAQAMLEEVVVTARRREENLQDLPLSIAAITGDAMEAQGIHSIEDVSDFIPNVTLTQSDRANNTRIVIRGIGGGHPDPVFPFGSGMYIDGHYVPNSLGGYLTTMDVERVEVLRGPQGTLFGKNVTGGLVNVVTARPDPEFGSSITLRAADHGQQDFRGMVNVPLSDSVYARLGVAKETMDGYYYNRNLNVTQGATDLTAFNAAIRFAPNDNWTIDLSFNKQDRADDNQPIQCNPFDGSAPGWGGTHPPTGRSRPFHLDRTYSPLFNGDLWAEWRAAKAAGEPLPDLWPDGWLYTEAHQEACAADAAAGTFVTSSDKYHFSDLEVDSGFATVQWASGGEVGGLDDLNVKFNASFRETGYHYQQDRDGVFYDIDNIGMPVWAMSAGGNVGQDNDTNGWEFLVEGTANERVDFTVGVNYFYELARNGDGACRERFEASGYAETDEAATAANGELTPVSGDPGHVVDCTDVISGLYFDLLPGQFLPFLNTSRIENESIGVFGQVSYAINDDWTLDVGARWTEDDRRFWNMESGISGCEIEEVLAGGTDADVRNRRLGGPLAANGSPMCEFTWGVSYADTVVDGFYNAAEDVFSEVTPSISLSRSLAPSGSLDSGMIYVLYSEGFLTGGFNTEINSNLPGIDRFLVYQPERVSNYELGFKGTFADGRVQIMADVFLMDYTDKQEDIDVPNDAGVIGIDADVGIRTNVASVDISGIELEVRASPWDNGFVSLDLGTLSNEYSSFQYPDPLNPSVTIDQSGNVIADLTPDWTMNVSIEHAFTLENGASITPRLNIFSSGEYDWGASVEAAPPSVCNQSSYSKVGARVTYMPAAGNWRASLVGNNITDELIYRFCTDSRGVYRYQHDRPAYWGLEFSADWGG